MTSSPLSNRTVDQEDLYKLGLSRLDAFILSGKSEDIEDATEYLSRVLKATPDDHPSLPDRCSALGAACTYRYRHLGQVEDIERSIDHNSRALALIPDGHPSLPNRHAALGASYSDRYWRLGQVEDLEKTIKHLSRALALTSDGHPDLLDRHTSLGVSYGEGYQRLGQVDDIEKAIEHSSQALALTPDGHPSLPRRHAELGAFYGQRHIRMGQVDDIEKAIEHISRALTLTPDDHPDLRARHADLGRGYSDRYRRLGQVDDLEKSIEYESRALVLTPDGHPDLPDRHVAIGASYSDRYRRLGQVEDLEKATEHVSRALALTPDGHPSLPDRHGALGVSYGDRYQRLGQVDDLEKATGHFTRALVLTPDGHPSLPRRHADLGTSYSEHYRRLGQIGDLEKSIEHYSRALALTPDGHPNLPNWHAGLGASYIDRYQRLGQGEDIEKAMEHVSRALALTPNGHPDLPARHNALGVSYRDRYKHLGQVEDLEKSIEHYSRALALTPDGHPNLPNWHAGLGVSYTDRYHLLGQVEDIERSIDYKSRALALTPDGHPLLSDRHATLGVSYDDRYRRLGQAEDLEKVTEHVSRALALTSDGHPDLPDRHAALGATYSDRYRHLGQVDDLEKATEHLSQALVLTPDGHPELPPRHFNQALSFWLQYQRTGDSSYLAHTLLSFRNASQIQIGSPRVRFQNALQWAKLASKHSSLNPIEAYQTTIDLLPQFIWLGATTRQRYRDISATENLAIKAAAAAIVHSDPKLALVWLEHTRCVVWNQTLMLRSPIDELHSSHPDLAARLQIVSQQLHEADLVLSSLQARPFDLVDWEQIGKQRRRLIEEYDGLLVEARMLPGFEDLLRPMKARRLVHTARYGPIAVINCHEDRCDALLVLPGQGRVQHLPLPNFTQDKAKTARVQLETSLRNQGVRERGFTIRQELGDNDRIARVLLALWKDVVKPVLEFLGYMNNVIANSLPHITWCPTGTLSFLPLHAAGDYNQPGSRAFDYVVSSYVPTLTALLASTPSSSDRTPRLLAIGQEHTPGHSPLLGTEKELTYVANHTQGKAHYTKLTGIQATPTAVLDAMEKHDWVHLACHAHQNVSDPTKSGFFLHDGTLDLAAINRRSFKNKGLAFLSACQTAAGDENLPDEAIHLASGMLMAGYPSVIATMWSVMDDDAPLVADKVYAELMKTGRVGNGEAGRALHNAVGRLRNKVGEKEYSRWVPYIHMGS